MRPRVRRELWIFCELFLFFSLVSVRCIYVSFYNKEPDTYFTPIFLKMALRPMETSKRYNSVPIKIIFSSPGYPMVSLKFLSCRPLLPYGNEFWDKTDYTSVFVKKNCALFSPSPYFQFGLSDDVVKISPLATPVAMPTNFVTKIYYNSALVKIITCCFHLHPYFWARGYPMVSFKLFPCRSPLLWQQILGQS